MDTDELVDTIDLLPQEDEAEELLPELDEDTQQVELDVEVELLVAQYEEYSEQQEAVQKASTERRKRGVYYVGMFSGALSMVVMGIAFIIALFTPRGVLGALRLSPIILVFLGLEIGLNLYFRRGKRLRIDYRGFIACGILIFFAAMMANISVATSSSDKSRTRLTEKYENIIENDIISSIKTDNVKDLTISLSLNDDDISGYLDLSDIKDTDTLTARINFRDTQPTLKQFSSDCSEILSVMRDSGLPYGDIVFVADSGLDYITLSINGKLEMSLSERELARLSYYFAGDFHEDLEDLEAPD